MESGSKTEENVGYSSITAKKAQLQSMLSALLDDPILFDVPKRPTLADVDTLINLELGSAMKISVTKMDNTSFDVAVLNSATVKDLKLAIRKKINEIEQAKMGHRHISWRHVWANFCLAHHNDKLIDDNSMLTEYGIHNNSKGKHLRGHCSGNRIEPRNGFRLRCIIKSRTILRQNSSQRAEGVDLVPQH